MRIATANIGSCCTTPEFVKTILDFRKKRPHEERL